MSAPKPRPVFCNKLSLVAADLKTLWYKFSGKLSQDFTLLIATRWMLLTVPVKTLFDPLFAVQIFFKFMVLSVYN